jgi:hypothetical protein
VITVSVFTEAERADVIGAFEAAELTDWALYVQGRLIDERTGSTRSTRS